MNRRPLGYSVTLGAHGANLGLESIQFCKGIFRMRGGTQSILVYYTAPNFEYGAFNESTTLVRSAQTSLDGTLECHWTACAFSFLAFFSFCASARVTVNSFFEFLVTPIFPMGHIHFQSFMLSSNSRVRWKVGKVLLRMPSEPSHLMHLHPLPFPFSPIQGFHEESRPQVSAFFEGF